MSRKMGIVLLACLGCLVGLWPGRAHAEEQLGGQLGVGLCVPEIPFSGALARHLAAKRVAQHLSRALRRPVEGLAYLNPRDLRRDISAGMVHFAVVGPLFAATVPDDQILAQGRLAKSASGVWSILCREQRGLEDCKGKRLQIPGLGPETLKFVQDGVLGGKRINVQAHFKLQWSPDLRSAETAVLLDQADAVVAPLSSPGLVPVLQGYPVPPPAFVLVNRQVPAGTVESARKAMLSFTASVGTVQGWDRPGAGAYRKLAAFSGRQELGMELVPETGIPLDVGDLVKEGLLLPGMPELDEPLGVQ